MYCIVAGPHLGPTSLRLASLPLDPVTAARVEAGNRLPAVLPQNLVPSTAAYLAGLAKVRDAQPDAPSIAPAASNDGAGLDIPAFLRRDQP
jgi:hypothetical protein